jgi:hypothetical protein
MARARHRQPGHHGGRLIYADRPLADDLVKILTGH